MSAATKAFTASVLMLAVIAAPELSAQPGGPNLQFGAKIPPELKRTYGLGLAYLQGSQDASGSWSQNRSTSSSNQNGIDALCILAILASGEDPNFGRFSANIRRGLTRLVSQQDAQTGYFESSMYNHGFCMLALAEAYGAVDESLLWAGTKVPPPKRRPLARALELAVRCATTSQDANPFGAWRYSPEARDADTSVAGAVLMGLLAARNAGIQVPDGNMERALEYFGLMTGPNGAVGYSGFGGGQSNSLARSSIATLVFAIGKRKDSEPYEQTSEYIQNNLKQPTNAHFGEQYTSYYLAQALFQSDYEAWSEWNTETLHMLKNLQQPDGSFASAYGKAFGTSMSLLALALNYRFLPIYER